MTGPSFDKEKSKSLLAEAGWIDTDGDGYVDKNGQKLTIRWLTKYLPIQEFTFTGRICRIKFKRYWN